MRRDVGSMQTHTWVRQLDMILSGCVSDIVRVEFGTWIAKGSDHEGVGVTYGLPNRMQKKKKIQTHAGWILKKKSDEVTQEEDWKHAVRDAIDESNLYDGEEDICHQAETLLARVKH